MKTIIEEEWKQISVLFTKHDENWHNGQTYKVENNLVEKDKKNFQFKTIIEKINYDYFIYDEIIERKDRFFLSQDCMMIKKEKFENQ